MSDGLGATALGGRPQGLPGVEQQCDWICGASLIVLHEVFQRVGYLDEARFLHYEEVNL